MSDTMPNIQTSRPPGFGHVSAQPDISLRMWCYDQIASRHRDSATTLQDAQKLYDWISLAESRQRAEPGIATRKLLVALDKIQNWRGADDIGDESGTEYCERVANEAIEDFWS